MTEPILSDDEILEALTTPGLNVEASLEPREVGLLCAAISDLLGKVCGEPIYQIGDGNELWRDVEKDDFDLAHHARIVYALTWSKP